MVTISYVRLVRDEDGTVIDSHDANQEFAAKYGVRNIPTVLIKSLQDLGSRSLTTEKC